MTNYLEVIQFKDKIELIFFFLTSWEVDAIWFIWKRGIFNKILISLPLRKLIVESWYLRTTHSNPITNAKKKNAWGNFFCFYNMY